MKTRCKDGDLAIITRDEPGLEANIGRFLWVYGPVLDHPELGRVWETSPVSDAPMAFLDADGTVKLDRSEACVIHPDTWMVPVRGRGVRASRPPRPGTVVPFTREWLLKIHRGEA
jgi:hypothetical protein